MNPSVLTRRARQNLVADWVASAFGQHCLDSRPERAMRVLEEAYELAQAEGVLPVDCERIARVVFSRDSGLPNQEAGGVSVCLLAWAHTAGVDLDAMECLEIERVFSKPIEHFQARGAEKRALAVSNAGIEPEVVTTDSGNDIWEDVRRGLCTINDARRRLGLQPFPQAAGEDNVLNEIIAERRRQINKGYTAAHDDEHSDGAIAIAAGIVAALSVLTAEEREIIRSRPDLAPSLPASSGLTNSRRAIRLAEGWPFDGEVMPSATSRRDLVKAAAMLVAEIERIDRLAT